MNKLQKGKYILFFIVDILTNHSELENSLGHMTVLNADSVYVVTMTTLLLNLRLSTEGYYESENKDKITMTEVGSLLCSHFKAIWKRSFNAKLDVKRRVWFICTVRKMTFSLLQQSLKIETNAVGHFAIHQYRSKWWTLSQEGLSWSYGRWIYNYLCN